MPRNIDDLQEEYERYTALAKQHFEVADFYLSIVRDQLHQMNEYFDGLDSAFTIQDIFNNINNHLLETQKYMQDATNNMRIEFLEQEDDDEE
ncbi:hypothetical protein [Metasolibacillus sp. FSL K6-0083]|uniref:hypothetical protein n=1 Tax=Metasolibacillus sp. FSL K6-0083 TaxID=2921416 RepID=UPI00315B2B52